MRDILGVILAGHFSDQFRPYLWSGGILLYENLLLGPNNFVQEYFMKIEWLVTDVTPVGSPDRAERLFWG